jgi:long-chain acyl-CoA synthetase
LGEQMSSTGTAQHGTVGRLWQDACRAGTSRPAFLAQREGGWAPVSWADAELRVDAIAAGLVATGIDRGDRVALLARTRLEWTLVDMAVSAIGAVLVPIYPTASADEVNHIVRHCHVSLLIAETARQLRRASPPEGLQAVVIEAGGEGSLAGVAERGSRLLAREPDAVSRRRDRVEAGDVFTLLYTSGTTGVPKACVLTHRNFTAMAESVAAMEGLVQPADSVLLFLPLAHNFARLMQFVAIQETVPLIYCRDFIGVPAALQAQRPTLLPAVPRVYERVASQARAELHAGSRLRSALAGWALATGRKAAARRRTGLRSGPLLRAQVALADRIVFSRVRDRFGGQLRFGVSGGAALPPPVAEFFDVIGIQVLEGYGLSEATCASHFNRPGRARLGTVGPPLPGVECRLGDDGEILIAGETVFAGYLDDEEATAAILGEDGWLRTGDIGEVDADGYLRIVDRKKDLIVTSGGKNISPQKLEQALAADPLVSQALVIGDGRPYLVALIAPDRAEAQRLGLDRAHLELRIADSVKRVNDGVGKAERIARHRVLDREFSQEAGEITATLKLRRRRCAERFAADIDLLYADRLAGA